ncbi:hypothetical protein [Humibacter ginsengiterrae]
MSLLAVTILVAFFGMLVVVAVLLIGLARAETPVGHARRRAAGALRLRPWPRKAVVCAAIFIISVNIGGVIAAATHNPLINLVTLGIGFIALVATGIALRNR